MEYKVMHTLDQAIKKVWTEDLPIDYDNSYLLKEDSVKNAFYFHLRTRLGDRFLNEHNLRIFTEYYIRGERVDLAIVEIDPVGAEKAHLRDCVIKVLVAVEMKYKSGYTNEAIFYQDIEKIFNFISTWGRDAKHYFAFIQEKYYKANELDTWIDRVNADEVRGKVTELYAYWEEESDETVWRVVDY